MKQTDHQGNRSKASSRKIGAFWGMSNIGIALSYFILLVLDFLLSGVHLCSFDIQSQHVSHCMDS